MQQLKQPKQLLGMAAALLANVIFGFSFLFSKIALQAAHPLVILAVRFTVAFAVLNLLLLTGRFRLRLRGKPLKRLQTTDKPAEISAGLCFLEQI